MTFSGLPFLLGFLPLYLLGSAVAGRCGVGWMKLWLIAVSLLFYVAGSPRFLPLLLVSVAWHVVLLRVMDASAHPGRWAACGIVADLGLLGWFKFATHASPLGISFYTFSQITCLLFYSEGKLKRPGLLDQVLFAVFFPAMLAGPVLSAREMLPQLARRGTWRLRAEDLAVGAGFLVLGLLKKTLLADPLAPVVAAGFADADAASLVTAWQAAMGYSLQLYFDFSGYTDMAIGLAWMIGLRFPDNFEQPYRARSVIDYWQRWHMSLTRFLVAHVHAPLTLAIMRWRRGRGHRVDGAAQRSPWGFLSLLGLPVAATMMLVSLWHGDRATFLAFGALHTGCLLINHAWRVFRMPALPVWLAVTLTYLAVLCGAVIFRADTLHDAGAILAGMAGWHGAGTIAPGPGIVWFPALYGVVWFAPTTRQFMLSGGRFGWRDSTPWAMAMGSAAMLGVLAAGGTGEFLYFRF